MGMKSAMCRDRLACNPAVAVAVALALVAMTASSAVLSETGPRAIEARITPAENGATRIMAAAVAAARDLLGIDHLSSLAPATPLAPAGGRDLRHRPLADTGDLPALRLASRLLDLPPPLG